MKLRKPKGSIPTSLEEPLLSAAQAKTTPAAEERVRQWLIDQGCLPPPSNFQCAGNSFSPSHQTPYRKEQYIYRCQRKGCPQSSRSERRGTLFGGRNIALGVILMVAYYFLDGDRYASIANKTGLSDETVREFCERFNSVIVEDFEQTGWHNPEGDGDGYLLGGPGIIVEIDESKFGKRMHNRGRRIEGVWILGAVERTGERRFVAIPVKDRTAQTMEDFIEKYIHPGSILYSDMWKGYCTARIVDTLVSGHNTINHSKDFVDPETGVHTNTIESTWRVLKARVPRSSWRESRILPRLTEMQWRRQHHATLWESFWKAVTRSDFPEIVRNQTVDAVKHEENQWLAASRTLAFEERVQKRRAEKEEWEETKRVKKEQQEREREENRVSQERQRVEVQRWRREADLAARGLIPMRPLMPNTRPLLPPPPPPCAPPPPQGPQ
uniref:ISXO2-like transposase domain-containing protein n=1 Tax=Chromera velia CCMP2878 TaxID=1169474 RepID=A0A0G4I302_9ALVE|eukprot:Cvel_10472.t1-p1 / transcript=Cvel_10472.t1 / gene=Cvel_10472 / organism=Chromera_velia_CCMP2878 / gene_product=hypothetical protein / transcript_product=hypothetical protein / location=Cvel_scaffold631:74619-76224(+) / protein_length=438 / sequence_SO=supercontig / SO=protein_coding / is_pseudo=false